MTTPALEITGVSVSYGSLRALENINLLLRPGRVTALIGMNGSGKSTLFNAIVGQVRPNNGEIHMCGKPGHLARREGLVAYVPQHEAIDWQFPISVREVVMMGRYCHQGLTRKPQAADHAAVEAALARVELTELAHRRIGALSGGQRKRAFVARGIAQGAPVLLLDEPFAGVDKPTEGTITGVLRDLSSSGHTILIATHDLHAVPDLADEVVLLRQRVRYQGPTQSALQPERLAEVFGLEHQPTVARDTTL